VCDGVGVKVGVFDGCGVEVKVMVAVLLAGASGSVLGGAAGVGSAGAAVEHAPRAAQKRIARKCLEVRTRLLSMGSLLFWTTD
jgi:hypothetical protein